MADEARPRSEEEEEEEHGEKPHGRPRGLEERLLRSRTIALFEPITPRSPQTWNDLLGEEGWRLAGLIGMHTQENPDRAATRVWVAKECLKKAAVAVDAPLLLREAQPDGWVCLRSGTLLIATYVASVRAVEDGLAIGILVTAGL